MPDSLLPASLAKVPFLQAFDTVMQARIAGIDLSLVLVYLIDNVAPIGLPYLADQFGIASMSNYKAATSDDERRALIKEAINLRAAIGTVAAVKNAITVAGFDPTTLVERCGTDPATGWAVFKLAIGGGGGYDGTAAILLRQLITDNKNARSSFAGVEFTPELITDALDITGEEVLINAAPSEIIDDLPMPTLTLDGSWSLDGSMLLHPGCEDVHITIS